MRLHLLHHAAEPVGYNTRSPASSRRRLGGVSPLLANVSQQRPYLGCAEFQGGCNGPGCEEVAAEELCRLAAGRDFSEKSYAQDCSQSGRAISPKLCVRCEPSPIQVAELGATKHGPPAHRGLEKHISLKSKLLDAVNFWMCPPVVFA